MRTARRFTIADAMILVPAAAVGALVLRSYLTGFLRQVSRVSLVIPDTWGLIQPWFWLQGPVSCVVVPWMAAMILIRLRQPRPSRFRLACQPGFVACVTVLASLIPGLAWYLTIRHRPGFQRPEGFEQAWVIAIHWTSYAVVGAWTTLALARRFRSEPSWIDRTGRVLGAYWIITLLVIYAIHWAQAIQKLVAGWSS